MPLLAQTCLLDFSADVYHFFLEPSSTATQGAPLLEPGLLPEQQYSTINNYRTCGFSRRIFNLEGSEVYLNPEHDDLHEPPTSIEITVYLFNDV